MPKGIYDPALKHHGKQVSVVQRFWSKVDKDGPVPEHAPELGQCWVWTAGTFGLRLKYGQFQMDGGPQLAHRVAWYFAFGEWPEGQLAHACDRPLCVRLEHLFKATALTNNQDMIRKGRHPVTGKLTDEQADRIRDQVATGPRGTARRLSVEHGVSEATISLIVHGLRRPQR